MIEFFQEFKRTKKYKLLTLSLVHGIVHSVIIIYSVVLPAIRAEFGWSLSFAGWVGTAGFALFGLTSLPAGWLADRLSKKILLLCMAAGIFFGALIISLAFNPLFFIAGWLLVGFFGGMYHPLALSLIAGSYRGEAGKALAWHGSGGNLTIALTPVVAGLVAAAFSWRLTFFLSGLTVLFVFFLLLAITESESTPDSSGKAGKLPPWNILWVLFLAHCLTGFIYRGVVTFIPHFIGVEWGEGIALSGIGGITTLIIIFGVVGQFAGGALAARLKFWPLYLGQVIVYSLALFLAPFLSRWFFVASLIVWGIVYFSTQPVVNAYLARFGSGQTDGRLFGLAFFINYGFGSLGAGISGQLAELAGPRGMFWGLSFIALVITLILSFHSSRLNKFVKNLDNRA